MDLTNWQLSNINRKLKFMSRDSEKAPKFFSPKVSKSQPKLTVESARIAEKKLFIRYAIGVDEHKTSKGAKIMLVEAQRDFVNDNFMRDFGEEAISEDFLEEVKQKVFGASTGMGFAQKYGRKNGQ